MKRKLTFGGLGLLLALCATGALAQQQKPKHGKVGDIWGGGGSLPQTLTAPGVFTGTQQNENFSIVIGSGCTPSSIFQTTQAGNFGTDGVSGTVCVPSSGVSNGFSSGVHGYASNAGAVTGCAFTICSAVAVAGDGISIATGSPIWAGNFVAQTTSGHAAPIHAVEIDANAEQLGDSGEGLLINNLGASNIAWASNGAFPGIRFGASSQTAAQFSAGVYCDVGATREQSCLTAAAAASGNSQPSQTVEWDATNSGGSTVAAAFHELATGTLTLFGGGGILQLPHTTVSALPSASTLGTGAIEIVTDATAVTGGTCAGSGSITTIAVSNGTNWVCP